MTDVFPLNPVPFNASKQWPEPDGSILNPDRTPAPEMTDDEFGLVFGPWADWLKVAAEVKSAHVDYIALGLLTAASAVVGNARVAAPWDGWKEPSILWGMLIGDPSSGKSPAQDAILDPIKALDDEDARAYKAELARIVLGEWKLAAKKALSEGEEPPAKPKSACPGPQPIRPRIRIADITIEACAAQVAATWRGLLLARDELSGWVSSMDRYAAGGDRAFWLEAFGGRSYPVDRKSSPEPIIVDRLSISIFGGTQPDKLAELLLGLSDDGLLARFLVVFPDPVPLKRPIRSLDEARIEAAFTALRGLAPAQGDNGGKWPFFVNLTEDAKAALHEFRIQCREWEGEAAGLMKSHIGKMPGFVVRVAHTLAHLDWCAAPDGEIVTQIKAAHIERAAFYVGVHLRSHAERAYGTAPTTSRERLARRLAQIIHKEGPSEINIREIQRRELAGKPKATEIKAALDVLVEADWIAKGDKSGVGRPKGSYIVNPRVGEVK